jgi:hypothetical protein
MTVPYIIIYREALEVRRKRNKAILMYRILNNQGASSLKESFTRISALKINYNLRNSSTDFIQRIAYHTLSKTSELW